MKNKFGWFVALLAVLAAAYFFLKSAGVFGLATLPDEGRQLVIYALTAALTWVLLQLGMAFGVDLSGYVQPAVAVLAPIIIAVIERYLNLIPPVWDNIVVTIIHLLVLLAGSVGTLIVYRKLYKKQSHTLLA